MATGSATAAETIIEVGQIWADKVTPGRRLKVTEVDDEYVTGWSTYSDTDPLDAADHRHTRVKRKRFASAWRCVQPIGTETDRIAREEIGQHYADRVAEARRAYDEATAKLRADLRAAQQAQAEWQRTGQITTRHPVRPEVRDAHLRMEVFSITADSSGRYLAAAKAAIDRRGDAGLHAAAETARARQEALRRWLAAQGYPVEVDDEQAGRTRWGGAR
jgi:hypothetical protein